MSLLCFDWSFLLGVGGFNSDILAQLNEAPAGNRSRYFQNQITVG
jgi:hypothetical protein